MDIERQRTKIDELIEELKGIELDVEVWPIPSAHEIEVQIYGKDLDKIMPYLAEVAFRYKSKSSKFLPHPYKDRFTLVFRD